MNSRLDRFKTNVYSVLFDSVHGFRRRVDILRAIRCHHPIVDSMTPLTALEKHIKSTESLKLAVSVTAASSRSSTHPKCPRLCVCDNWLQATITTKRFPTATTIHANCTSTTPSFSDRKSESAVLGGVLTRQENMVSRFRA